MIRRLLIAAALLAVAGCTGPVGPAGPSGAAGPTGEVGPSGPGYDTPVSISAVLPRSVAVGVQSDVTISGYATKWTDQSVVSFGTGVTVRNVKAASPTAMLATIIVSPTAMPGPRDVTVREGSTTTTFSGFEVLPYATLNILGTPVQGALVRAHLVVNDPMFAFAPNQVFTVGAGVTQVRLEKQLSRTADVLLGVNLDAAPGMRSISLSAAGLSFADVLNVTANAPVDPPAFPAMVDFTAPYESVVYNLTDVPAGTVVEATEGAILGVLSPDAGWSSTSKVGSSLLLLAAGGTVTVFDSAGDGGMTTVTAAPIPEVADAEPNDTNATAQTVTSFPVRLTGALTLTAPADLDWYKIVVPASAVGKRVRMTSTSTAPYDYYVDIQQNGVSLGGPWELYTFSNLTKTALSGVITTAGDLFIQLRPYDDTDYTLTLVLE